MCDPVYVDWSVLRLELHIPNVCNTPTRSCSCSRDYGEYLAAGVVAHRKKGKSVIQNLIKTIYIEVQISKYFQTYIKIFFD